MADEDQNSATRTWAGLVCAYCQDPIYVRQRVAEIAVMKDDGGERREIIHLTCWIAMDTDPSVTDATQMLH